MPYNLPVLKELAIAGYKITVVHDTVKKLTPFTPPDIEYVNFFPKENFTKIELKRLAVKLMPSFLFVCDRTNSIYNCTAVFMRKKFHIPVIVGCDAQWHGGKQLINILTFRLYRKRYYSNILVAGFRQFEYAKKLGFANNKILWPMLSADNEVFSRININIDRFSNSKNILYVGRFAEVKGLRYLVESWNKIIDKKGFTLTLVGNGPLKDKLNIPNDIIIHDFMNQNELAEMALKSTCFVLPSIFEPWALVIHEFAAAGMPLIVTSACGATQHFVINNYNGFIVEPANVEALSQALEKIILMDNETLIQFSKRSRELSQSINPKMVSAALLSVIDI